MTQKDLDFIKDFFSQIIDDIGGNPDWHEAARAVASDLGTLERKLEEKVSPLPSNLDEAAEEQWAAMEYASNTARESTSVRDWCTDDIVEAFKAGAEWMAGQGVTSDGVIFGEKYFRKKNIELPMLTVEQYDKVGDFGDKVVIQIRKK